MARNESGEGYSFKGTLSARHQSAEASTVPIDGHLYPNTRHWSCHSYHMWGRNNESTANYVVNHKASHGQDECDCYVIRTVVT